MVRSVTVWAVLTPNQWNHIQRLTTVNHLTHLNYLYPSFMVILVFKGLVPILFFALNWQTSHTGLFILFICRYYQLYKIIIFTNRCLPLLLILKRRVTCLWLLVWSCLVSISYETCMFLHYNKTKHNPGWRKFLLSGKDPPLCASL